MIVGEFIKLIENIKSRTKKKALSWRCSDWNNVYIEVNDYVFSITLKYLKQVSSDCPKYGFEFRLAEKDKNKVIYYEFIDPKEDGERYEVVKSLYTCALGNARIRGLKILQENF